jgi:hypothetical protein
VESTTQTLHRLTSYQPGREWDEAIDDPRIVQDPEANDMSRLPWFVKRYPEPLPRTPLPRELPATAAPAVAVLAGTAEVKPAPLDLPHWVVAHDVEGLDPGVYRWPDLTAPVRPGALRDEL